MYIKYIKINFIIIVLYSNYRVVLRNYRKVYKYIIIYNRMTHIDNTILNEPLFCDIHINNMHTAMEEAVKSEKQDVKAGKMLYAKAAKQEPSDVIGLRKAKGEIDNLHFDAKERKIVCDIKIKVNGKFVSSTIIGIPLDSIFDDMLSSEITRLMNLQNMLKSLEE